MGGAVDAIQFLLSSRANVNARAAALGTPLHYAARYGQLATASALLEAGADCTAQDRSGDTPLDDAEKRRHLDISTRIREVLLATETQVLPPASPEERPGPSYHEDKSCAVCMNDTKNMALVPCGHVCLCEACCRAVMSSGSRKCPVCRIGIESTLKVYL